MSNKKPTVEYTSRQVIQNRLLTSLAETDQVAILAGQKELRWMIEGLRMLDNPRAQELANDFETLWRAAYHHQ